MPVLLKVLYTYYIGLKIRLDVTAILDEMQKILDCINGHPKVDPRLWVDFLIYCTEHWHRPPSYTYSKGWRYTCDALKTGS
jgi:hypothetical protein